MRSRSPRIGFVRSPLIAVLLSAAGAAITLAGDVSLPTSPEELRDRVQEAYRNRDPQALLPLFYWPGMSEESRRFSEEEFPRQVTVKVREMHLGPLGSREPTEFVDKKGVIYRHNLPAEGVLEINVEPAGQVRWAFGRNGRYYQFTCYIAADTIPDPKDDKTLRESALTEEERKELESYYEGTVSAWDFINGMLGSLQAEHPTLQRHGVRALRLILDDAAEAETTGRVPWAQTPWFVGPTHENRARQLREEIASGLDDSLPAFAFPLARYFLDREPTEHLRVEGMRILALVEGSEANSIILELIEHPRANHAITAGALHAAAERGLHPSRSALRNFALGNRPSLADSARALNDQLGYPPLPPFDIERAYRSAPIQRILGALDTLLVDPPPVQARFVLVDLTYMYADGDTNRWNYRGWLRRDTSDSIAIVTPSGWEESWARADTGRAESGEVDRISTATMKPLTAEQELAFQRERPVGGVPCDHNDQDLHRLAFAHWLARRGEKKLAAGVIVPLIDEYFRDEDVLDHVRQVVGLRVGYRMLVAFVGDRDYPKTMELARLIRTRYPDTMFSGYAGQLLVELPKRTDDFRGFRLPTPAEWVGLQKTLGRDEQIDYLCQGLRLLNCFQWGQPGGLGLSYSQTAEPQGMRSDASWGLDHGRTVVINPLVQLTGSRRPKDVYGDSLALTIADIPRLASHLREDWFILGVEFWRDFKPERSLYRTSQVLSYVINDLADEQICEADDWPLLNSAEMDARIRTLVDWARENETRTDEERVMRQLDRAERWFDAERILPKLYAYGRKDAVPRFLTFLEQENTTDFSRIDIFRACRKLDPTRAVAAAARFLDNPDPGIRIAAGIIQFEHGDRKAGRRAIEDGLQKGTYSDLSPGVALEGVNALLAAGSDESSRAAEIVFTRDYFQKAWNSDRAPILKAFIAAGRPAPYRWLIEAVQDTTPQGYVASRRPIQLRLQDWIAQLIAEYLAPPEAGLSYRLEDPEEKKAEDRARIRLWLEERLAALGARD